MFRRLLFGFALIFLAVPASVQESLLDVVLTRDKLPRDAEIKHVKELNDPKFTYAILNVPPTIARAKQVLPNVKTLLLAA